jgi:hypothetical protein
VLETCVSATSNSASLYSVQVKARLAAKKKAAEAAAAKKKSIAAAAAAEAKARAKKAGGKKDTSHWNQAPTR